MDFSSLRQTRIWCFQVSQALVLAKSTSRTWAMKQVTSKGHLVNLTKGDQDVARDSLFVMEQNMVSNSSWFSRRRLFCAVSTESHWGSMFIPLRKVAHDQEGAIVVDRTRFFVSRMERSSFHADWLSMFRGK